MSTDTFESAVKLPTQKVPAVIRQEIANTQPLSALERAKTALAECLTVDQAKGIADEARAIAYYAQQKKGAEELLRMARQIQIRAYRRMGELLKGYARKFHGMSPERVGIRLATMDEAQFEAALAKDRKGLTVHEFARKHVPSPPPIYSSDPVHMARRARRMGLRGGLGAEVVSPQVLTHLKAFRLLFDMEPQEAADTIVNNRDREKARELVTEIQEWLDDFERRLKVKRKS